MRRLKGKTLFVTAESECWKITEKGSENVAELTSNQEEADTRLLLHAKHAAQEGYEAVAVISEDADVFVLLLNFSSIINEVSIGSIFDNKILSNSSQVMYSSHNITKTTKK